MIFRMLWFRISDIECFSVVTLERKSKIETEDFVMLCNLHGKQKLFQREVAS